MLWRKFHLNWRYAIGEFAIVVLGVLAAFAVENWNSDRKDRQLEIEYIAAILEDLRKDDAAIQFAMQEAEMNSYPGVQHRAVVPTPVGQALGGTAKNGQIAD